MVRSALARHDDGTKFRLHPLWENPVCGELGNALSSSPPVGRACAFVSADQPVAPAQHAKNVEMFLLLIAWANTSFPKYSGLRGRARSCFPILCLSPSMSTG